MAAPARRPEPAGLIRIGELVGAHGLRGESRLRSFAENPADIAAYSPLVSADGGRSFAIGSLRPLGGAPDMFIARIAGIDSREAAEALAGTALHVGRERAAGGLAEDEYLHADLVGCKVETPDGKPIGEVAAIQNFGAGDLIEVRLAGSARTEFVPFAQAFVPVIDLAARKLVLAADPTPGK